MRLSPEHAANRLVRQPERSPGRAPAGARLGRSRKVLPRTEAARGPGAGRPGSFRAHPLVRAAAGGVGDGVVDRPSRQDRGATGAQTENRPWRCATPAAVAARRSFSPALDTEPGEPRPAAVAVASASPGADAHAGQEPIAIHRHQRRGAASVAAVEQTGTGATGIVRAAALERAAAARFAATAGPAEPADRRTQPGHRAGSGAAAGSAAFDDPSRSRADHRAGLRVGPGYAATLPLRQAGRQLSGTDSLWRRPKRQCAAMPSGGGALCTWPCDGNATSPSPPWRAAWP